MTTPEIAGGGSSGKTNNATGAAGAGSGGAAAAALGSATNPATTPSCRPDSDHGSSATAGAEGLGAQVQLGGGRLERRAEHEAPELPAVRDQIGDQTGQGAGTGKDRQGRDERPPDRRRRRSKRQRQGAAEYEDADLDQDQPEALHPAAQGLQEGFHRLSVCLTRRRDADTSFDKTLARSALILAMCNEAWKRAS